LGTRHGEKRDGDRYACPQVLMPQKVPSQPNVRCRYAQ
jgi:hypothetical protein